MRGNRPANMTLLLFSCGITPVNTLGTSQGTAEVGIADDLV